MKILFRSMLLLAVLLAGIYATVPLWFPRIVATQLPPGWELVDMDSGYPGLSAIRIKSLSVTAAVPLANLAVFANDILVDYRTRKTGIGSLKLEVELVADAGRGQDGFLIDDLAIPLIDLNGELPKLSVRELHLALHHGMTRRLPDPVLLELRSFELTPLAENSWRFNAGLRPEGAVTNIGRLAVESSAGAFSTEFQFPSSPSLPPWLTLALRQSTSGSEPSTRVEVSFDAAGDWQGFLTAWHVPGFAGEPPRIAGKVQAQAEFSGKRLQAFEQMALSASGLQVELEEGIISADLKMLTTVEGPGVRIVLPESGQIRFQDRAGKVNMLLERLLPDFEFAPQTGTAVTARFENGTSLSFRPGNEAGLRLAGDVHIDLISDRRSIELDARHFDLEMAGFDVQGPLRSGAEIGINWKESAPLTARLPGKTLRAQSYSLSSKGAVHYGEQGLEYEQACQLDLQDTDIALAGDEESPPMSITVDSIAAEFKLSVHDGASNSNGKALVTNPSVDQPPTMSDTIEIAWQDFDPDRMAGQLTVRTTGFSTEIEEQDWHGFELDSSFRIDEQAVLSGKAALIIPGGSDLPFSFVGSAATGRWDVLVPPVTIMWDQLENTLQAGQFPWPAGVKMTAGEVALQGQLALAEKLTASLKSHAFGLGAAILKNNADDAGFDLDITLSDSLSASGPVSIESAVLAGGVQVSGFTADLELENAETLTLRNPEAMVFGGTLRASRLRFTPDGIEDTVVRLEHIDLSLLLAFLDVAGLQGTGDLGFVLPLGSDKDGIHVREGTVQSAGAGFLSYRQEGVVASNIGLQALENFHYQSLSGTIEYQSRGKYQIGIRLEGKNPDLYGGHPIVFRLNINGVMPALFEALFMSGNFEEAILNDIKTR